MEHVFSEIKLRKKNIDYLTGLLNRRGLDDVWEDLPEDMILHGIYVDVDNFKLVNDIYGHSKGDDLLVYVAQLLNRTFDGQIVVRMGGDEFFILCRGEIGIEQITKLLPTLQTELKHGGSDETIASIISFSIGVVFHKRVGDGLSELLQQCDEAMYYIKKKGKGNYVIYDWISEMIKERNAMKERALIALKNEEIQVQLRPVVYMQTSDVYAAEVVLHWDFPSRGILPEEKFLPIFVQYGVVSQIDAYVFEQICQWKASWRGTEFEHMDIYVRVSSLFILKEAGINHIHACLEKYQVNPQEIMLCIEEKEIVDNSERMCYMLQSLMDEGFQIVVNNFGSASPFMVLQEVPFHILKLDARLCLTDKDAVKNRQLLKNVISLGLDLKHGIFGQGVENTEQVTVLASYGAQFGTGSFYGIEEEEPVFRKKYAGRLFMVGDRCPVFFPFKGNLKDSSGRIEGEYIGTGLTYSRGVIARQGALVFPGGSVKKNIVELPKQIIHSDSYSICFWVNPDEDQPWTSAVYMTFTEGFLSLVPSMSLGFCFRIKDDREPNMWNDILCRQAVPGKWSYICATYDMITGIARLYFNGFLAGSRENVPCLKVAKQIILGGDEYQVSYKGKIAGLEIYNYVIPAKLVQEKFLEYQMEDTFWGTSGWK